MIATFAIYVCCCPPEDDGDCCDAFEDDQLPAGVPVHPGLCILLPLCAEQDHHLAGLQEARQCCSGQRDGRHQEDWRGSVPWARGLKAKMTVDVSTLPALCQTQPGHMPEKRVGGNSCSTSDSFSLHSSVQLKSGTQNYQASKSRNKNLWKGGLDWPHQDQPA